MPRSDDMERSGAKRKGRRGSRGLRLGGHPAKAQVKRSQLTVGDLIAAAHDVLGSEVRAVARVLSSPELAAAVHRRIILV